MATHMRSVKTGLILATVLLLLMPDNDCRAFFYRPEANVSIYSEYAALNNRTPSRTEIWKVVPETRQDGSARLRFFPGNAAGENAVCELILPSSGSGEIVWKGIGASGEKKSATGLLLLSGYPAPCDVLPVGTQDINTVYQETVEAGGRIFLKKHRVSFEGFSLSQSRTMGWVRIDGPASGDLVMVSVIDEQGRLAVRQLWPVRGSWWLYEETPLRRSWLVK